MSWQRTDARRRHVEPVCETPPSRPADPLPVFAAEARDEKADDQPSTQSTHPAVDENPAASPHHGASMSMSDNEPAINQH
ncbi:hypothetical protein [Streptomyces malaysiensis]|uniref:hypothetical protein n=1 Tax=Streptomyces malaysiensis TaxID=92644 RepID=UPI0011CE5B9C|nr:hypothetical protein [Streptomyces malaysiensis]